MPLIKVILSRKVYILSVLFFVNVLLFTACKKQKNAVGKSAIDETNLLNSNVIDTFSLKTYTEKEDSVITTNPLFNLVGCYNDPVFGKVNTSCYTQIRLSGLNPNFGTGIVIDSFVMALEYGGIYGSLESQRFRVEQIASSESFSIEDVYYNFSNKNVQGPNLIETGTEVIVPNPYNKTILGTDTVIAQLRIKLKPSLAQTFLDDAAANFTSNEAFLSYFKGFKISVEDTVKPAGKGAVFYLNTNSSLSKLTIYYTQAAVQKTYDFVFSSECINFNHVNIINSGAVANAISAGLGQTEFYAQAGKSRARIEFPTITNLPKNALIQKAELVLPISYFSGSDYYPSVSISAATRFIEPFGELFSIGVTPVYDIARKTYVMDIRNYVQRVVNRQLENNGLYIAPSFFNTTVDRMIFNGPNTPFKSKPKLSIVYTTF